MDQYAFFMKNILDINNLSFGIKRPILHDISWSVKEGEHWVLLGANGAGKTSLLSTICAYNTPSAGSMSVAGKVYSEYDWREMRKQIAIVSAQLNKKLGPNENVLETVISGAYAMLNFWGTPKEEDCRRAVERMEELGISYLRDRTWEMISQGERQKVLIARALMIKPVVMFLDEPCSGLDPVARENFVSFMDGITKSPECPPIILATHHVEEIPSSFTHALVLKDGKVLAGGKIDEVITGDILSEAYGAKCLVSKEMGKFFLRVSH